MLLLDKKYLFAAREADKASDLYELLQGAIQLEHSTIPPYLTAAYSLKNGINSRIKNMILDIAKEEMLHMTIVANVLNAIGGKPQIDTPEFIPTYPGPLPLSIGNGLQVGLKKFSHQLVRDVFMTIEGPEKPLNIPMFTFDELPEFATIGKFYQAIIDKIQELGDAIFIGDPARQVVMQAGFPPAQNFAITNAAEAVTALKWIIEEGEGSSTSPIEAEAEPAHYYRFQEIVKGRELVENPASPAGYSFSGWELQFDPNEVWDIPDNPKESDYDPLSEEFRVVHAFNVAYSDILRLLQRGFDGDPQHVSEAVQRMGRLRRLVNDVVSLQDPRTGKQCGLTFEYVPTQQVS